MSTSAKQKLTPAERKLRAQKAANTRWSRELDRHAATAPGRRAMDEHWLAQVDLVDPDHLLPQSQRLKMARNARDAHLAGMRLKASKLARARREAQNEETAPEEAVPETDAPAPIGDQYPESISTAIGPVA